MKKVNLSFMAVMIISLVIILIMNAMAVFAYHDKILSIEIRKDDMLGLSVKYFNLLENMHSNANQYRNTNDEKFRLEFYSLLKSYEETRSFQIDSIRFNEEELRLYNNYLGSFQSLVGILKTAVTDRDYSGILSPDYNRLYGEQAMLMTQLSKSYVDRLNASEAEAFAHQRLLKYSLAAASLLLLGFATATFCLILRRNAYNSYFNKLYNTVVENSDGGIAILDKDYCFDYMNPKYREILGIATEDIKGKTLHDTFDQNLADILENATSDTPCAEGKLDLIIGSKKKNILYSCFIIEDEWGNNKYVHLIRDTTKTEELQLQLRNQLKEINFYSRAKDSFIANISHEIKTPINAILGMVHFLKSTPLSQDQRDLVRKIETSSDILLTIISDVLDLSKIKNNSLSLYPSDFSLGMVIRNVEDMFSNQLAFKGIEWRTDYDFNPELSLHLDKTRFVQVLVNLINNAYKFTDSGYLKLSVETLSENEETALLQFCVEDTGIGIAEKDISKLFREFEQLENHLTKQHQGTGLGLFICKNIIESMDGRMWVKSTKGQGSKFYFSLPAKKSLKPELAAASSMINAVPLDGSGGKALVVEDTEINAEVAVKLLNDVNIACDIAADGAAAIQICKGKPADYYNLILMDIHMPNMDGYTAAGILKREMKIKSPIVALTATDINDQTRSEHRSTIESFILKPFRAMAFYNAISPYFSQKNKAGIIQKADFSVKPDLLKRQADKKKDPFAGREEAIKNLGGLESIYYKHVEKFKNNYADTPEQICSLLEAENYDEARRLAHSVKGLGGTLGMLNVMASCSELEMAILKGDARDLKVELDNFGRELKAAIDAI